MASLADVLKHAGISQDQPDDYYDPIELEIGTQVELEHTQKGKKPTESAIKASTEVAKDHIDENPFYYTSPEDGLQTIEDDVKEIMNKVLKKHGFDDVEEYIEARKRDPKEKKREKEAHTKGRNKYIH